MTEKSKKQNKNKEKQLKKLENMNLFSFKF